MVEVSLEGIGGVLKLHIFLPKDRLSPKSGSLSFFSFRSSKSFEQGCSVHFFVCHVVHHHTQEVGWVDSTKNRDDDTRSSGRDSP